MAAGRAGAHGAVASAASWHHLRDGRLVLEVHVQPGASRTGVSGLHGDCLKIRLAARAVDGEANACLIEFLAAKLGVARRAVTIELGQTSRRKRVSVQAPAFGVEQLWNG